MSPVASPVVESLMRSRSSGFFNVSAARVRVDAAPAKAPALISQDFTPGQTLALLKMRGEAAREVHDRLMLSTARATLEDYADLATLGYAIRKADGYHRLTPRGHFKANALAKELAAQLGVSVPTATHTATTRKVYEPGVKARFNFW